MIHVKFGSPFGQGDSHFIRTYQSIGAICYLDRIETLLNDLMNDVKNIEDVDSSLDEINNIQPNSVWWKLLGSSLVCFLIFSTSSSF